MPLGQAAMLVAVQALGDMKKTVVRVSKFEEVRNDHPHVTERMQRENCEPRCKQYLVTSRILLVVTFKMSGRHRS